MFRLATSLLLVLTLITVSNAAESLSDKAISDAITLLEVRLRRMNKPDDVAKVKAAIAKLRSIAAELTPPTVDAVPVFDPAVPAGDPIELNDKNLVDFIDNTEMYKGKLISLVAKVETGVFAADGKSLRDLVGDPIRFSKQLGNARLDVLITIPAALDVPKASYGDRVLIVFLCGSGSLQHGNKAKSIRRSE
jgi:hypothetical protein